MHFLNSYQILGTFAYWTEPLLTLTDLGDRDRKLFAQNSRTRKIKTMPILVIFFVFVVSFVIIKLCYYTMALLLYLNGFINTHF